MTTALQPSLRATACSLLAVVACATPWAVCADSSLKYYRIRTVAQQGVDGTIGFSPGVSLNAKGEVAFVGLLASGETIFLARPQLPLFNVAAGLVNASRTYLGAVQVNASGAIGARDRVSGSPPTTFVRRWDPPPQVTATYYAGAGTGREFDGIVSPIAFNDAGQMAFGTTLGGVTSLTTAVPPGGAPNGVFGTTPAGEPIRPSIANDGTVVFRKAGQILSLPVTLQLPAAVVASSTQFSAVGLSPGISRSGKAIAFTGTLKDEDAAKQYGGVFGDAGVFVSIDEGTGRRILRLDRTHVELLSNTFGNPYAWSTRRDLDGFCDNPGFGLDDETCASLPLGYRADGSPIYLAGEPDGRISVMHQELGASGLEDDAFVVVFAGAPSDGEPPLHAYRPVPGIWSVTIRVRKIADRYKYLLTRPIPVLQKDDRVDGVVATGLAVYDSVAPVSLDEAGQPRTESAGDHRIAAWINSDSGQRIVTATWTDSDGDGLADHWEQFGIDYDGDGVVVDLPLNEPPYEADPAVPDLFVEFDSLFDFTGTNRPNLEVLDVLTDAYARAPRPIRFHALTTPGQSVDEDIESSGDPITFVGQVAGERNDFGDFRYGTSRTVAEACSDAVAAAHFGTVDDRKHANCKARIGARALAVRYVLFGTKFTEDVLSSGIANIFGSKAYITYFAVGAGLLDPIGKAYCGQHTLQQCDAATRARIAKTYGEAATVMHEFGHNLGLRHGGSDEINCKPNYFSVMNYNYQFPDRDPRRPLSYAVGDGYQLDEESISDFLGIGQFPPGGWSRTFYAKNDKSGFVETGVPAPIDWNDNGTIIGGTSPVNVNLYEGGYGCDGFPELGRTPLRAFDDWKAIVPDLRYGYSANELGASSPEAAGLGAGLLPREIDAGHVTAVVAVVDPDEDGIPSATDNCPAAANPSQSDGNGNGVGDACDVNALLSVPDVVGLPQAQAQASIVAAGLALGTVTQATSGSVPAGSVISQQPVAAAQVQAGAEVALVVSLGSSPALFADGFE